MIKKYSLAFCILIFTSLLNLNTNAIEPDVFVQSTVNRAADTLSGDLSKEQRIVELKKIAADTVDIKGIGFYSLGKHRKNLSDDKINEYSEIFHEYFMTSFSSRLAEYSNPIIEVNSKEKINENYTIVSSTLVATEKRPEIKIEWRIYTKNPDKPLIRDLIIEGLSLARTQKEEFNSIIQSADGDIEALLTNLKNFSNE
ncbi:MlaC/ttg2D family ABC transporter substrate-binding protein [Candidatus Pelagibacter sp.]|uniref:MlaC/ttg2D family ABC transporter substrate-binding protein n=1 Tax=Candidatus Pelagibacter sp. TaxID=2024849 RepID=UPI003F843BC2